MTALRLLGTIILCAPLHREELAGREQEEWYRDPNPPDCRVEIREIGLKKARRDDVILSPGRTSKPKRGYFPFSLGKREPDSFTVGPYQVGIVICDGIVEYVFEGEKRSLPEGEVQVYAASTAPFKLIFRFKGPDGPSQSDDIILDPPLLDRRRNSTLRAGLTSLCRS